MAGMTPARRSLRAVPLPCPWRRSIVTSTISIRDRPSDEEGADGGLLVRAADGLAQERRDGEDVQLGELRGLAAERDGVGDDELVDARLGEARDGVAGEHRVGRAGEHERRSRAPHRLGRGRERARRVDHVVDDDRHPAVHLADDLHLGDLVRARAPLVDDGEVGVQAFGEGPRTLDAARVGRDDGHVAPPDPPAEVLEQHGGGVDVVDRHVEEALDLAGVQVDRQHARGAGGGDQVGHQLGADRHARRDLPILTGVAVVGYHRRDAPRRRPFEGVEHQEQLHQVVVAGRAGGLDHEHIAAAHVLGDLDLHLAVDVAADRLRQRAVRAPREYLDLVLHRPTRVIPASWAGRSRTFAAGSKVRCLTSLATAHQSPSRVPAKRGMLSSVSFDVNLGLLPPGRRGRKTRMLPFERVAHAAAARAGALLRARSRERQEVSFKGEVDLVTATDREAERLIVEAITEAFPEHGIVAEESAPRPGRDGHRWYVDPLDGTTNFAHGYPHFCVSIALARDDDLLLGLVYDPIREETFSALRGEGARLNGAPIGVSDTLTLERALLGTGFPYDRRQHADFYLAFLAEAMRRAQGVRRGGSAALDLCYVACGRLDAFWEWKLHPWDTAAGRLIVEEAGGRVTDFGGQPHRLSGEETAASNTHLHGPLLDMLAAVRGSFSPATPPPT